MVLLGQKANRGKFVYDEIQLCLLFPCNLDHVMAKITVAPKFGPQN